MKKLPLPKATLIGDLKPFDPSTLSVEKLSLLEVLGEIIDEGGEPNEDTVYSITRERVDARIEEKKLEKKMTGKISTTLASLEESKKKVKELNLRMKK
jgi:hypothetical protein